MTFLAVIQDIRKTLLGARVERVEAAGPDNLWIMFETPGGQESLLFTANDVFPSLSRGAARPAKGGPGSAYAGLAGRVLPGASLQDITHRGLDRTAALEFAFPVPGAWAGCSLVAELFSRQPNLILADRMTGQILEAARHLQGPATRVIAPGHPYVPPPGPSRPDPRILASVEAIGAALATPLAAGLTPLVALRQSLTGVTGVWGQEVVTRAGNGAADALARALLDLIHTVENGPWEPRLILDDAGRPIAASPVRLQHVPEVHQQPCASLGEMTDRLSRHLHSHRIFVSRQTTLRQLLRRIEVRLRSRRAKLAAEALEFGRADLWRRMGEILVAHQRDIPRGSTEVSLPDHASGPGATVTIRLDPALSPAANSERLFKAARRGRRGVLRVTARLAETEMELGRVQDWSKRVAEASALQTLVALRHEVEQTPRLLTPHDRTVLAGAGPTPNRVRHTQGRHAVSRPSGGGQGEEPRRFISSDGLPILVGRDNRGNDHLTLHLAKSHDLWLHVQGHAGSHVVIRVSNREGNVPRRTLIQAAQLAAYYSQARGHGKVAVDYTLRKYVHKPKQSKPGLVTISQEKTIIVSPDKSLIQKLAASAD